MAALLALAGACGWGAGDFLGGLAARRLPVLTVLAISQAVGLAGMVVWILVSGDASPGIAELAPAGAGGVAAMVGLGALYRGFAIGAMGIVAPISAAAPVVPLVVDVAQGQTPSSAQWLGVVLAVVGIVTLSLEPRREGRGRMAAGAGLAVVAALGFGLFFLGIDAGADGGSAWAVAGARFASVPVAVTAALLTGATLTPPRKSIPLLVGVGAFDIGANVLFAAATTLGAVGIVAVLGSLYPVVTIVLAWLLLGERLGRAKRAGGAVALAGAALVAAG